MTDQGTETTPDAGWIDLMNDEIQLRSIETGMVGTSADIGTVVTCDLKGYFVDSNDATKLVLFEDLQLQRFKIGEGDAIPGLELALRHSCVNSVFELKCSSKFGFGPSGRPSLSSASTITAAKDDKNDSSTSPDAQSVTPTALQSPGVPPDANLLYRVTVRDHYQSQSSGENGQKLNDTLDEMRLRKECGNRWFSYGEYARAGRCYSKGAEIGDNYIKGTDDEAGKSSAEEEASHAQIFENYIACLNNLAACHICRGDNFKAKEVCIQLLTLSPSNVKGLLRAARASLSLHDYEECDLCLTRVLEIDPTNAQAQKELNKLRQAKKAYYTESKAMSKRMTRAIFAETKKSGASSAEVRVESAESIKAETPTSSLPANAQFNEPIKSNGTEASKESGKVESLQNVTRESGDKANSKELKTGGGGKPEPVNQSTSSEESKKSQYATVTTPQADQPTLSLSLYVLLFTSLVVFGISIIVGYLASQKG